MNQLTIEHIYILATIIWLLLTTIVYQHSGFSKIKNCFAMFLTKEYWTSYNIIEFISWLTKAIIIIPGLIFNIQIWWLYILTLATSLSLIWASNKKLLPTLVGFNTIWAWISCMVIAKHIFTSI